MSGLYIHVPFCARRCPYCDFAIQVGASAAFQDNYVVALERELRAVLRSDEARVLAPLSSIFFGGGTPTALSARTLRVLLQSVRDEIEVIGDAEISVEANPENLMPSYLAELRAAGFNRLSMGAQSFDDEALKRIGRRHTSAGIDEAMRDARSAGFENISLDLMFALPGQSRDSWRETLHRALSLRPEHVSCYALTIEEGTPFWKRAARGQLPILPDEAQAELMDDAYRLTQSAGILRYEVSNYARAGRECRHNINYWRGGNYLAAGCGAHGHIDGKRWWNVRDAATYTQRVLAGENPCEGEENLDAMARLNERLMLGVRLREGFAPDEIARDLGIETHALLNETLCSLRAQDILVETCDSARGRVLALRREAFVLADAVAVRLMVETS
jgi:oxygen-independent coproporphyrinogen-3 oxidase